MTGESYSEEDLADALFGNDDGVTVDDFLVDAEEDLEGVAKTQQKIESQAKSSSSNVKPAPVKTALPPRPNFASAKRTGDLRKDLKITQPYGAGASTPSAPAKEPRLLAINTEGTDVERRLAAARYLQQLALQIARGAGNVILATMDPRAATKSIITVYRDGRVIVGK